MMKASVKTTTSGELNHSYEMRQSTESSDVKFAFTKNQHSDKGKLMLVISLSHTFSDKVFVFVVSLEKHRYSGWSEEQTTCYIQSPRWSSQSSGTSGSSSRKGIAFAEVDLEWVCSKNGRKKVKKRPVPSLRTLTPPDRTWLQALIQTLLHPVLINNLFFFFSFLHDLNKFN